MYIRSYMYTISEMDICTWTSYEYVQSTHAHTLTQMHRDEMRTQASKNTKPYACTVLTNHIIIVYMQSSYIASCHY